MKLKQNNKKTRKDNDMNRSKLHLLWNVAATLLLSVGFASCSQDDMPQTGGTPLPDGKYPLSLTATVGTPQTRTGGKDQWQGGEAIAVSIGDYTGKYTMDANGNATAAGTPYYWQNTTPATVSAWYPYAEGQQTYDISDQSQGYAAFDFLYAETEGSYKSPVKLTFLHQMAKVSYTLVKGQGISDAELNAATVTFLGDKSVTVSGGKITAAPTSQTEEIKPCHDAPALSGSALMVPQDMTGKPLIKVSISGSNFIYTPGEGAANLQSGTHYIYTITVKKDGIEVNCPQGVEWTDNETSDTQSPVFHIKTIDGIELEAGDGCILSEGDGFKQLSGGNVLKVKIPTGVKIPFPQGRYTIDTYEYKDDFSYICQLKLRSDITFTSISETQQLQVGDFYYADGTCLDKLLMNRPCIGIVFKVGAGDADGISAYGDKLTAIQGYAVALHDVARFGIKWSENTENCGTSTSTTDYKGYENTQKIQQVSNYSETEYPICWKVAHFGDTDTQAPSGSSGWYLPAAAQMTDVVNLWKDNNGIIRQRLQELSTYSIYQHQWLLPATEHGYATSTEYVDDPTSKVCRIGISGSVWAEQKNYSAGNFAVRAVLTF